MKKSTWDTGDIVQRCCTPSSLRYFIPSLNAVLVLTQRMYGLEKVSTETDLRESTVNGTGLLEYQY